MEGDSLFIKKMDMSRRYVYTESTGIRVRTTMLS